MENQINKYEEALNWLTMRCMEPNDDYDGLVYDQVPDFEIETNIEPCTKAWKLIRDIHQRS